MLIVSDTSPVTNLIRLGQLDILELLFKEVIIPEKVYDELSNYEHQKEEIDKRVWIVVRTVTDFEKVKKLQNLLDLGEAEAIILAKEMNADFLIIDERKGRKVAEGYGLRIIGLLGVLIRGKKKGHLRELKPILDKLTNEIGFRISKKLYDRVLEEVGE